MPFPSNSGTKGLTLRAAWDRMPIAAAQIKAMSIAMRLLTLSGTSAGALLDYCNTIATQRAILQSLSGFPGLQAYARDQIGDATLDLVATFNAMIAACNGVTSWIVTNYPKDASAHLQRSKFVGDGSGLIVDDVFTPAQVAGLVPLLDTLIATID